MSSSGGTSGGGASTTNFVDLGLVDLVAAVMDGPTTLYTMPAGSFLASIRFTDDPASVETDFEGTWNSVGNASANFAIGTEKSFGWNGFAGVGLGGGAFGGSLSAYDSLFLPAISYLSKNWGYGPFAALDGGAVDFSSLVLSAAAVGPIQAALLINGSTSGGPNGKGVRCSAITAWAASTSYDSPESNTAATPGALKKCAIIANGTIWINDGTTGTSGLVAPLFASHVGGSVADGANIVWYDTASAPPTVGKLHAVAEIVTLISA